MFIIIITIIIIIIIHYNLTLDVMYIKPHLHVIIFLKKFQISQIQIVSAFRVNTRLISSYFLSSNFFYRESF
jgi:hypothetical protein